MIDIAVRILRHLTEAEAEAMREAGQHAINCLVYYAEPKRMEAEKAEALQAYGRAEAYRSAREVIERMPQVAE